MVRQQPQQHQVSDIPDYDPVLTPFQATNTATSNTSSSSNCSGRYFVLPLSTPNTPVHTKITSIIQSQKKAQYDSQQKYREWYASYKEAILARQKTLELENKLNVAKEKINTSMKEIEDEKDQVLKKLNDIISKQKLPSSSDDATDKGEDGDEQPPTKKHKTNTDDANETAPNENDDNNKMEANEKTKSSNTELVEPSEKVNGDDNNTDEKNNDDDLESLKLKHEKTKSGLDELHRTKSHFIWLLKQVITAENKRKEEKEKKKEQKIKNKNL